MPLPAEDVIVLRKWVGDEPEDSVLEAYYGVYENYDQVVEHVLINRLAQRSIDVGSITVPGLSVSRNGDLDAIKETLSRFYSSGGTGLEEAFEVAGGLQITSMKRNYPR